MVVLSLALAAVYLYLTRTDPAPVGHTFEVDAGNAPLSTLNARLDLRSAVQAKVDLNAEAVCRQQRQVTFFVSTSARALLIARSIEAPSRLEQTERCRNGVAELTVIAYMKRNEIVSRLGRGRESFDAKVFGFPFGAHVRAQVEASLFDRFETLYGGGRAAASPQIAEWDKQDGIEVAGVIGQPDVQAQANRLIDLLLLVSGAVLGLALSGRPHESSLSPRVLPRRRTAFPPGKPPRPPRWARESRKAAGAAPHKPDRS